MSIKEQILEIIKGRILEINDLGCQVYRSRASAFQSSEPLAISVFPGKSTPVSEISQIIDWETVVNIAIHAREKIKEKSSDQIADPVAEKVFSKIMSDTSLGGISLDITPLGDDAEFYEASPPAGVFTHSFLIKYRTADNSLTTTR